jgi:hypothetical protein
MIYLLHSFVLVPQPFELLHDLIVSADPLVDHEQDRIEGKDNAEEEPEDFCFHNVVAPWKSRKRGFDALGGSKNSIEFFSSSWF